MKKDHFTLQNLCESCSSKPCCTNCDSPFLFEQDLINLSKINKSGTKYVGENHINSNKQKVLRKKSNSNQCIMWDEKNNHCSIYEHRPFDCRMFPFDIMKYGNDFFWVVYSCNKNSNWSWTEEHLQKLESSKQFLDILENIEKYSSFILSKFGDSSTPPFFVLREVSYLKEKILLSRPELLTAEILS